MIEGVRLLPWIQQAARDNAPSVSWLLDCESCMRNMNANERRQRGCGYEPHDDVVTPWRHEGYEGPDPQHCIGYTAKLPEVIEVARAFVHWEKASLRDFTGKRPPGQLLQLIELLAGEVNALSSWRMKNPPKGD